MAQANGPTESARTPSGRCRGAVAAGRSDAAVAYVAERVERADPAQQRGLRGPRERKGGVQHGAPSRWDSQGSGQSSRGSRPGVVGERSGSTLVGVNNDDAGTPSPTGTDVPDVTLDQIRSAREELRGHTLVTPMEGSRWLSSLTGQDVKLKCENLQRTGSFKIRGAYLRISHLSEEERARGVVAASAGNHAQGVALAASMLGIKSTVFMPTGAPIPKEKATRGYGAEVRFTGTTIDECLVEAHQYADDTGAELIHPFDHVDIVAGQGTCGLEILEQVPDVQTILVPTGGGGFLAGIATAVKALRP